MISLPGTGVPLCEGLTRREWLRISGLAGLGRRHTRRAQQRRGHGRGESEPDQGLHEAPAAQTAPLDLLDQLAKGSLVHSASPPALGREAAHMSPGSRPTAGSVQLE